MKQENKLEKSNDRALETKWALKFAWLSFW